MSLWHLRVALWVLTALLVLSVPLAAFAGIWLSSTRFGWTSFLLFCCAAPAVGVMGIWTESEKLDRHARLTRAERRRLRDERARIRIEAEIAAAEREAGIR